MDFYYLMYKLQYHNGGEWEYRSYLSDEVIVIASSYEEATEKINYCMKEIEKNLKGCRVIRQGDVKKAIGLKIVDSMDCKHIQ